MSIASPTAYLLWATLATIFFVFLIAHIWLYDQFRCLRLWNKGASQPGTFKRIMTYSYLLTVPLLMIFAIAMTFVKYREGYVLLSHVLKSDASLRRPIPERPPPLRADVAIPRPYSSWSESSKSIILPIYYIFSEGWALEVVTHLEELSFWLFLLHQGPRQRQWFKSWEFRFWCGGSMAAVVGLPLTVASAKRDMETCLAWVFIVGSVASTFTTLCFLYILARFPAFLRRVKLGGADTTVLTTLASFYRLNILRVIIRFFFTIPLLIVAIDSVSLPHKIVQDPFWSDILVMIGGIGCFSSSAITLIIFFPRGAPTARDSAVKPQMDADANFRHPMTPRSHLILSPNKPQSTSTSMPSGSSYKRARRASAPPLYSSRCEPTEEQDRQIEWSQEEYPNTWNDAASIESSRVSSWIGSRADPEESVDLNVEEGGIPLHPYVTNFTSPIDIPSADPSSSHPHS